MPFITVIDTLCHGRVPGWKNEDGSPVVYATHEEAEKDVNDPEVLCGGEPEDDIVEVTVEDDGRILDVVDGTVWWTPPAPADVPRG